MPETVSILLREFKGRNIRETGTRCQEESTRRLFLSRTIQTSGPNGFQTPLAKQMRQKERCGKSTQDKPSPAKIMKPSRPCPHPCKKLPAVVSVIARQEDKAATEQQVERPPPTPEVETGKDHSMYDEYSGKYRFLHSA